MEAIEGACEGRLFYLDKLSHCIFTKEPHRQSLANLVILNKHYRNRDVDGQLYWSKIRNKYVHKHRKMKKLNCEYCGKKLKFSGSKRGKQPAQNSATIDHIIPLSAGGRKTDASNLCLTCIKCNRMKSNMLPLEFIKFLLREIKSGRTYFGCNILVRFAWRAIIIKQVVRIQTSITFKRQSLVLLWIQSAMLYIANHFNILLIRLCDIKPVHERLNLPTNKFGGFQITKPLFE
jgi:hypothetical protein